VVCGADEARNALACRAALRKLAQPRAQPEGDLLCVDRRGQHAGRLLHLPGGAGGAQPFALGASAVRFSVGLLPLRRSDDRSSDRRQYDVLVVAVSGSYILNSSITFAAESGRKLSWRSYLIFLVSGIVGWFANTATLIIGAQVFLLPVWVAKAIAIVASFVVNFSLSHFVVFRVRHQPTAPDEV